MKRIVARRLKQELQSSRGSAMSMRNFKDLHKAKDVVVLYFSTPASQWGETTSVTIPAADAQKLLHKLQQTLQAKGPAH